MKEHLWLLWVMEFVEELNSYNSAKSLTENSTKNFKEGIIPPTGKSECAFVPNPPLPHSLSFCGSRQHIKGAVKIQPPKR